jgi:hypothetical protein
MLSAVCHPADAHMSAHHTDLVALNPKNEEIRMPAVRGLADAGSALGGLPRELLDRAAIAPRRQRTFEMVDGRILAGGVGYCLLQAESYATHDEIAFAEPGDMPPAEVRTLVGLGVLVEALAHRLAATVTLVV